MRLGRSAWVVGAFAAASALHTHGARAQELQLGPDSGDTESARETEHPAGVYMGVKPGGNEAPAFPIKAGTTPAAVTWPGFAMHDDGTSRVFIQTTAPVPTTPSTVDHSFVLDLGDARIVGETNRFPLITKFFNTPVTRVELKRANSRTTLVISLRADVQPSVSTERAQSGFNFVYVDFPAGNYLTEQPQGLAAPSPPAPTDGAALDAAEQSPTHLDGQIGASGKVATPKPAAKAQVSTAMDGELPPGMAKPKAKPGKASASGKAKIGL